MEDFSYRLSPKVRDFASTQTTDFTSSHFSSGCKMCPRTNPCQKEDLTVTQDLKREYSKALNCIEILKLEKKNLQDALSFTKDLKKDKTEKYFVSSTKSTAAPSPKGDFRPMRSIDGDRRVAELEQDLFEQRKLFDRISAQNEELREENYNYREKLEQIDDLQLQNHQLKNDIKELTEEVRRESRKVYELQEENDQLLDRRTQLANSARKLPPKELYKYLDHVYELVGALNKNHYAPYHFRECFIDEDNIETLIEEKETNQLLVQSFRYITNLLVNINSSVGGAGSSIDQRRPSQNMLTDSESVNQARIERANNMTSSYNNLGNSSNMHYEGQEEEEGDAAMYPPNPTPNLNTSKNLNLNAVSREIDPVQPHSFGDAAPLSQQDLGVDNRNQSYSKAYSPSNSRYVASNPYSNKPNTDVNTTRRDLALSRNASAKSGVSISPNNRRDKTPSSKHATEVNALNVSKQSIARSHVSQRTAHQNAVEANAALNASRVSRQSQGKSFVSQRTPKNNGPVSVAEVNALNASRVSQAKSKVSHHTTRQNIAPQEEELQPQYYTERAGMPRSTHDLEDRELRLRELDRELQEKDRLLQMKEKELKDRSVMEKSMARYREQQEEAAVNRSALSQTRKLPSQKSLHPQEEAEVNRSALSQTRKLASQKSLPYQEEAEINRSALSQSRKFATQKSLIQQQEEAELNRSAISQSRKFGTQKSLMQQQEEAEMNRSAISQTRKLASQKSLPKERSPIQSRQRLDESRDNTRVLKSQTQLRGGQTQIEYERNNNNSVVQSRIIPSMSSLADVDVSPKAFGTTPKNANTQPAIKSLTRIGNSVQSLDPYGEYQRSPKNFSVVNSQKVLNVPSIQEVNEYSVSRTGGQTRSAFQDAYIQSFENSPQSKISPKPQTLERLENSGIKFVDQRGGEDYENSQIYENNQIYEPTPVHMGSPHSDTKRRITFDVRNLGEIEECESSPQSKSQSRKMSIVEAGGKQGTEYASFRVSFGRTQSKYLRSQSPDLDQKDSLYIVDVARRKRVTHHEQTYDVVQANEVKYELNSTGADYSVTKKKPRSKYTPRNETQSENNLDRSPGMFSPLGTYRGDNSAPQQN